MVFQFGHKKIFGRRRDSEADTDEFQALPLPARGKKGRVESQIIALANQKGGVGKTTTSVNLGTALAACGHRTLVIDLDSQGNAATALGLSVRQCPAGIYDVLMEGMEISQAASPTQVPNLMMIPGGEDLVGLETRLHNDPDKLHKLRVRIRQHLSEEERFEFILIDCPPSLSLMTLNAMTASGSVLVPLQCEFLALEGLTQLMRTIEFVRDRSNPELEVNGVLLTMYDQRTRHADAVARDVRAHFGEKVYETVIPRNIRLSEAPSYGKPALLYDHKCPGSQAYIRLAKEIIMRDFVTQVVL